VDFLQKSFDAIAFAVRGVFSALGVERCAARMACDRQTAYGYQVDQWIPTKRLLSLLAVSRETKNPEALECCRRILGIFAEALGCKVIDTELVEHMERGMDALRNGGKLHAERAEKCPVCRSALFTERTASGVIIQRCRQCFGVGTIEN
jgi:hypothetical protein